MVALVSAVTLQCAHSPTHVASVKAVSHAHRTVYVDTNFRDEELKLITESAAEWNEMV